MTYRLLRRAIYFTSDSTFIPYKSLENAKSLKLRDLSSLGETEISVDKERIYFPICKKETEYVLTKIFNRKEK